VVGLWERPERAPDGWVVDREHVDATVHAAMDAYDVGELAADPFGWHAELARWADAYGQVVLEFPTNQRSRMGVAVSRFTSAVMTAGLAHDGDPRLARHIGHVVARETAEGCYSGKTRRRLRGGSTRRSPGGIAHERAYWHATSASLNPSSPGHDAEAGDPGRPRQGAGAVLLVWTAGDDPEWRDVSKPIGCDSKGRPLYAPRGRIFRLW
jgi:hypothetical protein